MSNPVHNPWDCRFRAALTLMLMTIGALGMLLVAVLTLLQATRFYREHMLTPLGRIILWIWGIRVVVHNRPQDTPEQRVYISNHTSTLDVFVLVALGLPNTRFFLSGFLRKLPPLGLIGYLTGVFWTVDQVFTARRVRIFKRAGRILQNTGESVYLSPEGQRVTTGTVGPFNKGAFHLATHLRAPITPFYILIPPNVDPGMGICARPGRVDVWFKPAIDTRDWNLKEIIANKERIRQHFLEWDREHRAR
jgi:1-acyl-sn-glycerol-3-phosphate acyltransferase